jgi:ferredoxin
MTLYRIEIDRSLCVGYAGCLKEAPGVFELDDDSVALAPSTSIDPRVLEAADLCPVGAIVVHELHGEELAA